MNYQASSGHFLSSCASYNKIQKNLLIFNCAASRLGAPGGCGVGPGKNWARGRGVVEKQMPKKPEPWASAVSYLAQLRRGIGSIFQGNSRIHDCTFQSRAPLPPPPPGFGAHELGLTGSVPTAQSLAAHFSLDSHARQARWRSPNRGCERSQRKRAAGGSRVSHCCRRLGGVARSQLRQRRGDPPRAPRRSRGTAPSVPPRHSYGDRPPPITGLEGTSQQDPAPRRAPEGTGRRGEEARGPGPRPGGKAGESRRGAALHAGVSLPSRLEL